MCYKCYVLGPLLFSNFTLKITRWLTDTFYWFKVMLTMTHNYNNNGACCSPSTFRLIKYSPMVFNLNLKTTQWNRLWKCPEFHFTAENTEAQRGQGVHPSLHSWSVLEPNPQRGLFIPSSMFLMPKWQSGHSGDQESKKLHSRHKTCRSDTKINARC